LKSLIIPPEVKINIDNRTTTPEAMLDQEQMMQVITTLLRMLLMHALRRENPY